MAESELYHYGIKGQRWGVRRFQNEDGTLTAAGRERYSKEERKEIRAENKKAFALGKAATIASYAANKASYRTDRYARKLNNALSKNPDAASRRAERLTRNLKAAVKSEAFLMGTAMESAVAARAHADQLVQKYGSENVSAIRTKTLKNGRTVVDERVNTPASIAANIGITVTTGALMYCGALPVGVIAYSTTKRQKANSFESASYEAMKRQQKAHKEV